MDFWTIAHEADDVRRAGDFDEAIRLYTQAIQVGNGELQKREGHLRLGLLHHVRGDYEAAIREYTLSLRHVTSFAYAVKEIGMWRGSAFAGAGRNREALRDLDEVMRLYLGQADNRVLFYVDFPDNMQIAIEDMGQAVATRAMSVLFCRGVARSLLQDWAGALADYEGALDMARQAGAATLGRIEEWAFAQAVLQYGMPSSHYKHRVPDGILFCTVDYQREFNKVTVTYFNRGWLEASEVSEVEGDGLRAQLKGDGWVLLARESHKEGDTHTYCREVER